MDKLMHELYLSYLEARKNKRKTSNQLRFEIELEKNIYALAQTILSFNYTPKRSIAFVIFKPVQREIFAADFSDRVVHHFIYRCIYKQIDKKLIFDNYSCRKGKGNLYGVKRLNKFIRCCSNNYQNDAYVLKLDILGYFMNINHELLFKKVMRLLNPNAYYFGIPFETIRYLLNQTIYNNVARNFYTKGSFKDWKGLPSQKSLLNKGDGIGLPIGNLTSQIFGNVFLNDFDHFVKKDLGIKYYGRYVDDMVFVHSDKEYLKSILNPIKNKINDLGLEIHPKKIALQHYNKGVLFLGHFTKPYRSYISNRTKNNFYQAIDLINKQLIKKERQSWETLVKIRNVLNSFLGTLRHANTYQLIEKAFQKLTPNFHYFFGSTKGYTKIYIKKENWLWHYFPIYPFTN